MRRFADLADRAIDLLEAVQGPSEPSPQQLVQLDRAASLCDQLDPGKVDFVAGRELKRAPFHSV